MMRYLVMPLSVVVCLLLVLGTWPDVHAENVTDAIKSLQAGKEMQKNADVIRNSDIEGKKLYRYLTRDRRYEDADKGWASGYVKFEEGFEQEYVYYVHEKYDPKKPVPVIVVLHGGVSRPQPIAGESLKRYGGNYVSLLDSGKEPFIMIVPAGTGRTPWWSKNGSKMVFDAIDDMKRTYNVDTDRVMVTGFSDGASGSYYLSMTNPTKFCQFWPFNGFAAVATMTGTKVYLESMKNRPMFACNTTEDSLYPPNYYNPFVKAMKDVGVALTFHEFENIGHNFAYIDKIAKETRKLFAKTERDPWANELTWVCADTSHFNRIDWIEILETGQAENSREFENRTVKITSGVKLGVNIDQNYVGEGVRVGKVEPGSTAANIGMQDGDVIIEMQGEKVSGLNDLRAVLSTLEGGEKLVVVVERAGKREKLEGTVAKPRGREVLSYGVEPGFVHVKKQGNTFEVDAANVTSLRIMLSPDFVDFDKEVAVNVNGKEVAKLEVGYSKKDILHSYLRDFDVRTLAATYLDIQID